MPVDLYNIGVSGLMTAQQQLGTTGHNIANVDTEGYTRQQVVQSTQTALWESGSYLGTGVYTTEVRRIYDQFAFSENLYHQTQFSYSETYHTRIEGLDNIISKAGENLLDSVASFYDALNSVVDQPTDVGIRQVMLDKATALTSVYNTLDADLEAQYSAVNTDIHSIAQRMDEISHQLAALNQDIITASGNNSGAAPNDLLDRRDGLITELAQYTSVSTVEEPTGALTVIVGSGQTLVAGNTGFGVTTVSDDPDTRDAQIVLTLADNKIPLDGSGLGGQIGALYDYRDNELREAMNELGLMAMGIADAFNEQQNLGLDLNEEFGGNLFTDINEAGISGQRTIASQENGGTAQLSINIDEVSNLTGGEYSLLFDGTDYQLKDLESNQLYNLGAAGSVTMPDADGDGVSDLGFTLNELGGTPSAGDEWVILPTRGFASNIDTVLTNPEQIAASSVFSAYPDSNNVSPANVEITSVDPTATSTADFQVTFLENPAGSGTVFYDVLDSSGTSLIGGSTALGATPATITYGGVTMEVTGMPIGQASNTGGPGTPEVYDIKYDFGAGNNSNVVLMTHFQTTKMLKGDSTTIEGQFRTLNTRIGVDTERARIQLETSTTTFTQTQANLQSSGGVNLDEEASNLIKYQQSYQAAARIVTVAKEITDTILNSF